VIVKRAEAERRVPSIRRAPKWKKWFLLSADGTKNLGGYRLKREAVQREREVQFFKHRKNNPYREAFDAPERKRRWERRAMRDEPYTTEGAHVLQLGPSSLAMGNIPVTMRDPDDPKKFIAVPMLEEVDPGKPIWDRVGDDLYVKVIDGIHWGVRITEIEPEHEAGPYSYRVEYGPYTRPAWRDVRTLDPVPMPRAYTKTTFDFPVPARDVDILEQINDVIWDELDLEFPRRYNPRRRNPKPFGGREHDWGEVLIQKGSKRRTRKQIRDYYLENAKKIWPYLKNQTVMVILAPKKNEFVLRRKGPDGKYIKLTKLEGIDDLRSFEYWINRRVIEFHPVITGKTTPLVWIDIDPYRTKSKAMNRRMQRRI